MPVAMLSTSTIKDPKRYGRFNALDTENPFKTLPGMVLLSPTSINHTGTSASIGTNGQVTFTAVTALSVNGVFSSDFDNYMVSMRHVSNSDACAIWINLRASGSNDSSANYSREELAFNGTSVAGSLLTGQTFGRVGNSINIQRNGDTIFFYRPYLSLPTSFRTISAWSRSNAEINEIVNTHSSSSSYDGFTLTFSASQNLTGALQVYGVRS